MAESSDTKTLEAKCFCGSVHFTVDIPKSELPLRTHLCHCSLCRYASGTPCIFHTHLPTGLQPKFVEPSSQANMTAYPMPSKGTWNFCSTCGCHIASIAPNNSKWVPATSIFTDHSPENFQIWRHIYAKSAKDGGIAKMLTHIGGREFVHYDPAASDPRSKIKEQEAEVGEDGEDRLRAKCLCGGVSFTIKRPTQEILDDDFMSQFVSRSDKTKWAACLDACDDCRLVNGTHFASWTFLPLAVCEPTIKSDLLIGTAKTYSSSAGVLRSFCGTCGATVFYHHEDRRTDEKQVVDLSVGILRAPEGVMAENWLTWRARMAWLDSGKRFDGEFTEALQEGMNNWILEKEGEIADYNIG